MVLGKGKVGALVGIADISIFLSEALRLCQGQSS